MRRDGTIVRVWRHVSLLALVSAVVLSGCATSSSDASVSRVVDAPTNASEAEPAEQSLVVQTISGGQVDFADLLTQDTVLWFWAPW